MVFCVKTSMKHLYPVLFVVFLLCQSANAQTFAETEPNNFLGAAGVQTITSNGTYTGSYAVGDDEYYYIAPGTTGTITITWTVAPFANALELRENGSQVLYLVNPSTGSFVLNPANSYYIHTWTGTGTGNWAFTISGLNPAPGAAVVFDGSNDFIQRSETNFGTGNFCIETWVKPNSLATEGYIISNRTNELAGPGYWYVLAMSAGGTPFFAAGQANLGGGFSINCPVTLTVGVWSHLALTRQGTVISLYLNGILMSSGIDLGARDLSSQSGNNRIDFGAWGFINQRYFNGTMDEIRLWNVNRTQCQIQSFMNCEIPTTSPGLLANYHFNQGVAYGNNPGITTLLNSAGAGNGTLTNFALSGATSNWISPGSVVSGFTTAAVPSATLVLTGNGNPVPIGTVTSTLNNTNFGNTSSKTFSISNSSGTLNIGAIYFTGANATQFSVSSLPASSLSTGGTSFVILHTPTVVGTASAIVNIPSNDCTNPTYSFVITASTSLASALNFDGINDYINLGSTSALKTPTAITLECWAYRSAWTGAFTIVGNAQNAGYEIQSGGTNLYGRVFRNGSFGTANIPLASITPGWHHFALTYDGRYVKIYQDGILKDQNDAGATYNITYIANSSIIGAEAGAGALPAGLYFNGEIDEVRFWSYARSQCEIQTSMLSEIPGATPGLEANYHFNQGIPAQNNTLVTSLTDASGSSITGTLTNFQLNPGTVSNWVSTGAVTNGYTVSAPPTATISLSGNGNTIPIGTVTGTLNNTDFGTNPSRTFSISNSSGTLNIGTIYFSGANAAQFSVTTLPASSLTAGGTSFVILHTPAVVGTASAVVNIPSNDCTYPTYSFVITASASPASALSFDGIDDGVSRASVLSTNLYSVTMEAMVNWNGVPASQILVYNGHSATSGYGLYLSATGGSVHLLCGGIQLLSLNYTLTPNVWKKLSLTLNNNVVDFYENGVLIYHGSYPTPNTPNTGFYIGVNAMGGEFFNGMIDEVRFWERALTQCEIQTFLNCEIPTSAPDLRANYHFNQGLPSGSNTAVLSLIDDSGNNNHCTLSNFALTGSISNWVSPGGVANGFTTTSAPSSSISVSGNGNPIPMGTITNTLNNTDFGTNITRTYSISNPSGTLTIGSIYFSGANAAQFSLVVAPASSLATGGTSFVILHTPTVIGTASAIVNILSNDCAKPNYTFVIQATAVTASALHFDGSNDIIQTNSNITELAQGDFTIELWLKTTAVSQGLVVCTNTNNVWETGEKAFYLNASGVPVFVGFGNNFIQGNVAVNDGNWHHVAVTWDYTGGVSGVGKIYVDGVDQTNGVTYQANNTNIGTFQIGQPNYWASEAPNYFLGDMDEVRIWNRALCLAEVSANRNCEIATPQPGLLANYHFNQGVAFGVNSAVTTLTDASAIPIAGTLSNFTLTGATSNWVYPGGVTNGSTCPVYTAPEIDVLGNGVSIPVGAAVTTTNNHTAFGGVFTRTFSISNSGTSTLGLSLPLTLSGANASDFTISTQPPASVASNATVNFVVSFIPSSVGIKTAQINIVNTDCNENPYTFVVSGTASAAAALNLDGNNDYANAGNILTPSYTKEAWIKIGASANGNNILSNGSGIAGAALWAPGLYNYSLSAGHDGTWNAVQGPTLAFGTWYHVAVTYDQASQTMVLYLNGNPVATNSSVPPFSGSNPLHIGAFNGTFNMNGSIDEVRIWNRALCPTEILNNLNCEIPNSANGLLANYHFNQGVASGNNAAITSVNDVSGNNNNAAMVSFNSIGIGSNWETPGAVITGSSCPVITVPEINLLGNGVSINDGDITPSLADHSNFGGVCFGNTVVRTFSIQNTGSAALSISGMTLSGADAAMFAFGALNPVSPVASGSTAVFSVTFTPTSPGIKVATLNIGNNDCNESPYDFAITGTCNALPQVTANVSASVICNGQSTTLFGSGADTYTWTGNVNNNIAFNPTVTATYSLSGTNVLTGCTSTNVAVQSITVNPVPNLSITVSSASVCAGGTIMLSGSGANTYTWNPAAPNGTAFTPSGTTSYTLNGTSSAGCSNTSSPVQLITVHPLPVISVNSGTLCTGQSFTMLPQGADTYTYLNGGPVVSPLSTSVYSISGSFTATGCQSSSPAISTISVFITPTLTLNSGAICIGDSYTLIAGGASTYTYSSGSPIITPLANSSYSVNGTSADGCVNVTPATANVTVHPLPLVTAGASQTLICFGHTITLNGGGANTYTWSNGVADGTAFSPSATSAFTVTGTDLNNCKNAASISVSVLPLPVITVQSANPLTCDGETTTLTVSGANSFTWSTGAQTPSISVTLSVSTNFTVSGTDANSCVNTLTYTQMVDPCAGLVQVNTKLKDVTCKNRKDGEIELIPNVSYPAYKVYYFWTQPELCADSNCNTLKKLSAGTYPVKVRIEYTLTTTFSKIDTIDLNISLVDLNPPCPLTVYTGLTVNNDGVNDIFHIENIHSYLNNKVSIFNRWGDKMAQIEGYDNESKVWPDKKDTDKLISGTYYYIIDPGDGGEVQKGWIEVIKN